MQEEWLQENAGQMLARVEYALTHGQASISWGLPTPRWSLQQDQRNRRWVGWHVCFSLLIGVLCQQFIPADWDGVWWLCWWYVVFSLMLSIWFFACPYLYPSKDLITNKNYPRTVGGSACFEADPYAYWHYAPPPGRCHLHVPTAQLLIECGAKQYRIDLQACPHQLEMRNHTLILKPLGEVEGWVMMSTWNKDLDRVAKLLARRFQLRVIRY